MIEIKKNDVILFNGDSITDALRDREDYYSLAGYSKFVSENLKHNIVCFNRGVGGDTALQVLNRLEAELNEIKPTVFSLLIGVNDTWRRFDSNEIITPEETYKNVEDILKLVRNYTDRIFILEPFLLDVDINKRCFREDLSPRIWYIRDLARKYQCEFIPLNGIFAELSCKNDPSFYSYDGVHPTIEGHKIIAKEILKRIIQED